MAASRAHHESQRREKRRAVSLLCLRERGHLCQILGGQRRFFLLQVPQRAAGHQTKPRPSRSRMKAIDLLHLREVPKRRTKRAASLRIFQQAKNRFDVARSNLVPRLGNPRCLIASLPPCPVHPLRERLGMRIESARALVHFFGNR